MSFFVLFYSQPHWFYESTLIGFAYLFFRREYLYYFWFVGKFYNIPF